MSSAENLLYSLDSLARTVNSNEESHIVIGTDRYVTVPDELKRIAVQYDHNIETVTFDCPRYWDNHDMSEMSIYINYLCGNNNPGTYRADNVMVDDENTSIIHFDWTISKNVTMTPGPIIFLVCIRKADVDGNEENHWNSELCKDCYVSEGMEYDGEVLKITYPDIINQYHQEVLDFIEDAEKVKQNLLELKDSGEFDGATFTPIVSDTGDLSWTNDKGRLNPPTVNISGRPGTSPTVTVIDIQGGHRVTITDVNGSQSFDVMDGYVETSDAVAELINRLIYVGTEEPTKTPVLWFETV